MSQKEHTTSSPQNRVIFITGVPSSGKSTVTREFRRRNASFRVIDGDRQVRRMCPDPTERLEKASDLFDRLLNTVSEQSASHDVIVDMTLPASYVERARARFPHGLFVLLRITEEERQRREASRRDRSPVVWSEQMTALGGQEDLLGQHLNSEVPRMSSSVPSVPEWLDEVVVKLTQREPSRRFPSMKNAADALSSVIDRDPSAYDSRARAGALPVTWGADTPVDEPCGCRKLDSWRKASEAGADIGQSLPI